MPRFIFTNPESGDALSLEAFIQEHWPNADAKAGAAALAVPDDAHEPDYADEVIRMAFYTVGGEDGLQVGDMVICNNNPEWADEPMEVMRADPDEPYVIVQHPTRGGSSWDSVNLYRVYPSSAKQERQRLQNKALSNHLAGMEAAHQREEAARGAGWTVVNPAPAKAPDALHGASAADRKAMPLATGVIDYFPDALAAVAAVSRIGNEQHNPGKPLHWDRTKSTGEADCLARHFVDRGTWDTDGVRHSAKVAWRALALLQKEIDADRCDGDADTRI